MAQSNKAVITYVPKNDQYLNGLEQPLGVYIYRYLHKFKSAMLKIIHNKSKDNRWSG